MTERLISGLSFAWAGMVGCERDVHGRMSAESPARQFANPKNLPVSDFGRGPFAHLTLETDEARSGVYAIVVDGTLAFIGRTIASLRATFGPLGFGSIEARACYERRDAVRCRVNAEITRALARASTVEIFFHPTVQSADVERSLVARTTPPWNDHASTSPTAIDSRTASAIRDLHLAGYGVPEIAARLRIREALVFRIVAKMDRPRTDGASGLG